MIPSVGLTEEQAKARGYEVSTSVLPLEAVPRALVNRETTGVFKLVADSKSLKLLGAHIVAVPGVTFTSPSIVQIELGMGTTDG